MKKLSLIFEKINPGNLNTSYGIICSWIIRAFLLILVVSLAVFIAEVIAHPEYGEKITEICRNGNQSGNGDRYAAEILLSPSFRLLYFSIILFASASGISLFLLALLFLFTREYPAFVFSLLTVLSIAAASSGLFLPG